MRFSSFGIAAMTFTLAAAALGATPACLTRSCNSLYAPSQATLERTVPANFDPAKPIHVEICKNDDCQSGDFVVATKTATDTNLCRMDENAYFETGCLFFFASDGAYAFRARWFEGTEDASFHDGDRYRVTLTSSDAVLLSVDAQATYAESEPNGEGCGVTKTATL